MDNSDNYQDPLDADDDNSPSKTQLKKQMQDLQVLGKELMELPDNRLTALQLPENLFDAIRNLRSITAHEGRRRQLQYVGKLMRRIDPAPLREAVASYRLPGAKETLALHEAERWRDRLLSNDTALTQWFDAYPGGDVQALRTLIRNARKEAALAASAPSTVGGAAERKSRSYRELFQIVRQTLQAAAAATSDEVAHDTTDESLDD